MDLVSPISALKVCCCGPSVPYISAKGVLLRNVVSPIAALLRTSSTSLWYIVGFV